jgi:hypothetical protein
MHEAMPAVASICFSMSIPPSSVIQHDERALDLDSAILHVVVPMVKGLWILTQG